MSLAGRAWAGAAAAAEPLLRAHLRWRARRGKEVAARLGERRGRGAARPPGRLFWLHAASVGETLSALPLLEALAARAPDLSVLVTTGTATSAALLAQRLPPALAARVLHRFAPLDVPRWAGRFLEGWRPDAGAFVESELWPNLVRAARRRGVPLALVNARLSERSARRWRRAPGLAREVASAFSPVLARTPADAARLGAMGARLALCLGDLKDAAAPLPADPAELARLRETAAGRPVFLAASTHPGEEAVALEAHRRLAASRFPDLLTVLVPRHPHRGAAVAAEAEARGLAVARRAADEAAPRPDTAVYVADTLGELGLFYRLAGVCLVGGSLVPHGGQNPLEPARLGCPILLGPHTANFAEPAARLLAAGGALRVEGADPAGALAGLAAAVLSNPDRARGMAEAAAATAATAEGLPGQVADALLRLLPPPPAAAGAEAAG